MQTWINRVRTWDIFRAASNLINIDDCYLTCPALQEYSIPCWLSRKRKTMKNTASMLTPDIKTLESEHAMKP